jgi:hypothetical protein
MAVVQGAKTVSTSAVQLTATATPVSAGIRIWGHPANTGNVAIGVAIAGGNAGVTDATTDATDGVAVGAGLYVDIPVSMCADVSALRVIASAAGQRVSWISV